MRQVLTGLCRDTAVDAAAGHVGSVQDRERGVVWEETIIFLPPASRMVFLSATLSNAGQHFSTTHRLVYSRSCFQHNCCLCKSVKALPDAWTQPMRANGHERLLHLCLPCVMLVHPWAGEFAAWVAHVHSQPCHVVYTNYRPTPLQHYAFPAGGRGLSLV